MVNVESYFDRAGEIARQALKEMRLMVYELRPTTLEWDGLASVLKRRLDTVESRAGVECQLLVKGVVELPKSIEYALYQIAQEALNNALKYSKAGEVIVRLEIDGDKVLMDVADNGQGFDPNSSPCQGGMGLSNMCHRAEEMGGSLVIDSAPGKGTRVTVNVGLKPIKSGSKNGCLKKSLRRCWMTNIRILIADDHAIVREGLRTLILANRV